MLLVLGQVFGGSTFTSRRASDVLGMDFLHVAKVLFRMRRSNLLRVVARESRVWGGYENVYEISDRGFSKIRYLQGNHGTPKACPEPEPDMIGQAYASQYMLLGRGSIGELFGHAAFKLVTNGVQISPITDEVGMLLECFSPPFLQSEIFCKYVFNGSPFEPSYVRLVTRATHLQKLGYVPDDINLPLFIGNAMLRKSTEPVILLGLILRGSIELKVRYDALIGRLENATRQHLFSQPCSMGCRGCDDYERLLFEEKEKSRSLEAENAQIQWKLWQASMNASQQEFSYKNKLQYMSRRIDTNMDCLLLISKALNKFPYSDPIAVLIKSYVQDSFLIIATMNYTAIDYWLDG